MIEKIGRYTLTDELKKVIKSKIDYTYKTGKETGFFFGIKNDEILTDKFHCEGTRCRTDLPKGFDKFNVDQDIIGDFHTHPDAPVYLSASDLCNACNLGLSCIGKRSDNIDTMNCFIRKTDRNDCIDDAIGLYNENKELKSTYKSLNKMKFETAQQLEEYNKSINNFNKMIYIHNSKIKDARLKHFDTISIKLI